MKHEKIDKAAEVYGELLQKEFSDGARWLKENPNWHNVACGDLPLANCIVLCMYKPENTNHYNHYPTMAYLHYDWSDKIWSNPNDSKPVPKAVPDYWIDIKLPE